VVVEGSIDPSWRVREMSAKVVAKRRLDDAHDAMTVLLHDDVERVRAAAHRALIRLVESES
jgi:HEAT repeat protein